MPQTLLSNKELPAWPAVFQTVDQAFPSQCRDARLAGIPTVVCSGSLEERAARLATAVLPKPCDLPELRHVLGAVTAPAARRSTTQ